MTYRCPTIRRDSRSGFTLTEILCVIVLMALIATVSTLLLKDLFEMERAQARSFDQMIQTNELADLFRADVARAEKVLPAWKQHQAGPTTLILQVPVGQVIYRWNDGELERTSTEGKKPLSRQIPVNRQLADLEFVQPTADSSMVRLHLHRLQNGKRLAGQTLEIAAAVGGDWR